MRQQWPNITKCAILHRIGQSRSGMCVISFVSLPSLHSSTDCLVVFVSLLHCLPLSLSLSVLLPSFRCGRSRRVECRHSRIIATQTRSNRGHTQHMRPAQRQVTRVESSHRFEWIMFRMSTFICQPSPSLTIVFSLSFVVVFLLFSRSLGASMI